MKAVLFWAKSSRSLLLWLVLIASSLSANFAQGSIVFTNRVVLIAAGSSWNYWNQEAAPAAEWKFPEFFANSWAVGKAQLGYGDGDEATVTRTGGAPHPLAAYFRQNFTLNEIPTTLFLRLVRDDGAVVYINGVEVLRDNMPDGAITHTTPARETVGQDGENQFREFSLTTGALRVGENTIAVEVHQANAASSDLSFDLQLAASSLVLPDLPVVSIRATQPNTSEPLPNALIVPGEFTVTRNDRHLEFPLEVYLSYGGTASAADYEPLPVKLTIPAGTNSANILVLAKSDDLVEGTETVVARLTEIPFDTPLTSRGYLIAPDLSRAEVRIADEDKEIPVLPVVSLVTVVAETREPSPETRIQPGRFQLRRTGSTDRELFVHLRYLGTATPQLDYSALPSTVRFEAGKAEVELFVEPKDDSIVEPTETVVAELIIPPTLEGILPTHTIDPERNTGTVRIFDNDTTNAASLKILKPEPNSIFQLGQAIEISAVAIDPAGYIPRVEFYAGERLIGVSEIAFLVPPEPGTPITHEIVWKEAPAGEHVLVARARDSLGNAVISDRVPIVVRGELDKVLVSVSATDPEATELSPLVDAIDPATFEISRTGPTNTEITVFYTLHGTAREGADYAELPGSVSIPAGERSATIHIMPISDLLTVVEPMETVGIQLEPSPDMRPIPIYEVAPGKGTAAAVIYELNPPQTGSMAFALPDDPDRFQLGEQTTLLVAAFHPTLDLSRVEFLLGEHKIGVSEVVVPPGNPGGLVIHRLDWSATPPGEHQLRARATLPDGTILSTWITIFVEGGDVPVVGVQYIELDSDQPLPDSDYAPGRFYFTRSGPTNEALTVYFKVDGTATPGVDYTRLPATVVFDAGRANAFLRVMAIDDQLPERDETVVVTLLPAPIAITQPAQTAYIIDPELRSATVTIRDNDRTNEVARIEITSPKDGDEFPVGVPIPVEAVAVDPNGYIPRLEFYAGDKLIGVSEIVFIRAPDPGTPISHSIVWSNAPAGEHVLTARSVDTLGERVVSRPVRVFVSGSVPERVVLNVEAVDAEAAEWEPDGTTDRAVFVVRRAGGPTNVAVTVFYNMTGTASNGIDYEELSGIATMRAGQLALEIVVRPIPDKALEGEETVIFNLREPACVKIYPTPPECYIIGPKGSARAVIRDGSVGTNLPPTATITRPRDGAVFEEGQRIEVRAEGADRDGRVVLLELLLNNQVILSTEQNVLTYVLSNAPAGQHTLLARAQDDDGAKGESRPVRILVREPSNAAFVRRELPAGYIPGTPFTVRLLATPPSGTRAWAVEDQPPRGWTVGEVSDGGVFDAATGKVKFGHFTENRPRTLTYRVTPPAGVSGAFEFDGTSSADGRSYRITGDRVIEGSTQEHHPADVNKENRITLVELTAYAAAWKEGATWPTPPNPIPLNYVTRAALLWRQGEAYHFVSTNPAPQCWVPSAGTIRALAASASAAVRSSAAEASPGSPLEVTIAVQAASGTGAYAVEEIVPTGWNVTNVSDEGTFDPASGTIRWGLYMDGQARSLRYTLIAPAGVTSVADLSGTASFDGEAQPVTGSPRVIAVEDSNLLRMPHCERRADGSIHLKLAGAIGQVCALEASSDLNNWTEVEEVFLPDGELDLVDDAAASTPQRYYRLRVR